MTMVLFPRGARNEVSGTDTESLGSDAWGGASEGDSQVEEEEPEPSFPQPVNIPPRRWDVIQGCGLLAMMKFVPKSSKWRAALRIALEEVCTGCQVGDITRQTRGWKLFFLLPRMLLHKKPRGGAIPGRSWRNNLFGLFPGDGWIWWSRPNKQVQCDGGGGSPLTICQAGGKSSFPCPDGRSQVLEGAQMAPGTE